MTLVNKIRHQLRLNIPLGIYVLLIAAAFLLPASLIISVLIFLVLSYFLANVLWRRYLKKRGELGDSSTGLLLLVIAWLMAAYIYFDESTPEPPQIALYETTDPEYFSSTDPHPAPEATKESDEAKAATRGLRRGRFSSITGKLADKVESLHDSGLACAFLKQHKQIEQCSSDVLQESLRVEVDNNSATIELLVSEKEPVKCIEATCQVWLIQTTQQKINQFTDIRLENEELGKAPPVADASLITQWDDVITPVIVLNASSNGWRHVRVSDQLGNISVWYGPAL
ncbi:NfeD family protein [Leucothrix pacifica]|uniref:Uncharacterized protein n=1 Tax=Leucothrix pacifica TaxID=1247513 RepID=A0A317CI31_9GAMM|nr:hypothetical protein [Leucothrix pacifica]PWQ98039.1 hypothetical protein DKW60_08850 [Leucothrix pacifica]